LKKIRALPNLFARGSKHEAIESTEFVFCDKTTGVAQFRAEYGPDMDSTVERMASLLAMQCLVRGCEPGDYAILVPAQGTVSERLTSRAKELLDAGMAVANPVPLSARQTEILRAVVGNRCNKEIAAKFNITVRTVKFHISTLFGKFGVDNRVELARKATGVLRSQRVDEAEAEETQVPMEAVKRESPRPLAFEPAARVATTTRNLRFQQRVLSA